MHRMSRRRRSRRKKTRPLSKGSSLCQRSLLPKASVPSATSLLLPIRIQTDSSSTCTREGPFFFPSLASLGLSLLTPFRSLTPFRRPKQLRYRTNLGEFETGLPIWGREDWDGSNSWSDRATGQGLGREVLPTLGRDVEGLTLEEGAKTGTLV